VRRLRSKQSSIALVALSCVTVLGIAVASFLSVSSLAVKLSNRTYAKAVSKQLAEMGLERALRSFTSNTFGSWTLPDATTATRTISISSSHYGNSGITAAVNIKVYHYRDTTKAVVWSVWSGRSFCMYRLAIRCNSCWTIGSSSFRQSSLPPLH